MGMDRMDRGAVGWLHTTVKQNYWRVASWMDYEDLIQDGFYFYCRITEKYPNVTTPSHRMALFKTAFTNHIHDLAKKRTRDSSLSSRESDLGVSLPTLAEQTEPESPDTSLIIATLPDVLRRLIVVLQTDERVRKPYRRRGAVRETTNERLCRLVGVNPDSVNILALLHLHLSADRERVKIPAV